MKNPIKMDDLGVPLFSETTTYCTLPAIIMEVENGMSPILNFLTFRVIFHVHAYGRKGSSVLLKGFYVSNDIF